MAPVVRQQATGFAAAGSLTLAGTLPAAALAKSLLLWIVAGDKNIGTITQPSDTPNLPINDRTASVSQALAWGQADGGETVLSGTCTANIAGSQIWVVEITDDANVLPWARRSTAQVVDPGTDVTTVTLGPAPAATAPGIGIAAVAADSVNTEGTVSWSNGWTASRSTPNGGGQAGQWGAVKTGVALGATESTVFARTGGTADNHSAFLTVFGKAPGSTATSSAAVMGALAATGTGIPTRKGSGSETFGALVAAGTGVPVWKGSGSETFGALVAAGTGSRIITGAGAAIFGALGALGDGIDPPPTDLPLRAGTPVLASSWAAGPPVLADEWRAGQPVLR
jgi:hypothetical protein